MDSLACESDDDEELGAQIYRSSQTAKAFKLGIAITQNDDDDVVNGGDSEDIECDKKVLQVKNDATDHNKQLEHEKQPRAAFENSQQTLCRSRRARHSTATARAGEIGNVQNHIVSIDQKQIPQQPQPLLGGNGDQIIVRRSSRKRSPTVQFLHSSEITEEAQLKLIFVEDNSAMAGRVPKKRKHEQPSTKVKRVPRRCSAEGCTNGAVNGGICFRHGASRIQRKCSAEGCTNQALKGGVCIRHGAPRKPQAKCSVEECTNIALRKGVCRRHGAKGCMCSWVGCTNSAIRKGVCTRHGARRLRCSWVGCANGVVNGGVCLKHGAKKKKRVCRHEGCTSWSKIGGLCRRHGKEMKKCSHKG